MENFQKYEVMNVKVIVQLVEKLKHKMQAKAKLIRIYERRKNQHVQNKIFMECTILLIF
jgi:hypothetical protein